jgi:hypothetical protein
MKYELPQFIEEETRILGPLGFRQFFIFLGVMVVSFVFFFIFEIWLWAILTTLLVGGAVILALGKVHGRPMSTVAFYAWRYFWQPRRFIWKKEALKVEDVFKEKEAEETKKPKKPTKPAKSQAEGPIRKKPVPLTREKIKELAQLLDRGSRQG